MSKIRPFRIDVADDDLADLRLRLSRTRWPDNEPVDDWSQGMPLAYTRDLAAYWLNGCGWRAREAALNRGALQHRPLVEDASGRTLRGVGTTRAVRRRSSSIL
jgi:Epoxide hydrolase N terminus